MLIRKFFVFLFYSAECQQLLHFFNFVSGTATNLPWVLTDALHWSDNEADDEPSFLLSKHSSHLQVK